MDSDLEPVANAESMPVAAAFAPSPAPDATPATVSFVPPHLLERITIGPAPSWAVERPVEIEEAQKGGINPGYLLDTQHHAGRSESYYRSVRRLGTMNAVREASQWRVNIDPLTSRLTIHALIVKRDDRSMDNAKPERLRVMQREQGLESLELSGSLTVVVLLEDVRVGDILDISYTVESRSQLFPDHFSSWVVIPYWTLREFYWSVRFPKDRAMRWKTHDPKMTPAIREDGDEIEWLWHLSKLPGAEPEPNVPGWHFSEPWIQVTDFASWAEVASGALAKWKEDLQHPEVLRLVESISAQASTPTERATRALTYLQDEIRYLFLMTELGGHVPASPGEVIKRGFGDCKDKSFAAAHLLRLLGIPARPVIVHTTLRQSVQEFLPSPDVFNHAIVEYEVEGRRRWVDVTSTLQGGSVLSRPTALYQLGLPIGPGVQDLEEITSERTDDFRELRETFLIATTGRPSILRVHVIARGREADQWRNFLHFDGETRFAKLREQHYQQLFSGAKRVGSLEWHDDRERNELEIGEIFDIPDLVMRVGDGRQYYFRLLAHSVLAVLGFADSEKRKHPWAMPFPCHVRHIIEIDAAGVPQNLSRTSRVEGRAFRFGCQMQQRAGFVSVTCDLRILKDHVLPEEFGAHKARVREAVPSLILSGLLPPGATVPWKSRRTQNLLRRGGTPAAAPSPRPSQAECNLAEVSPAKAAPPLAPAAPRKTNLSPQQENKSPKRREDVRPHEPGGSIKRPNPTRASAVPPRLPGEAAAAPLPTRSRRSRRGRSQSRALRNFLLFAGIAVGGVILFAMMLMLMHAK